MISAVTPFATAVADGSGNARASIPVPAGSRWAPRLVSVDGGDTASNPTCTIYRGSSSGPVEKIDSTNLNVASTQKIAAVEFYGGHVLWAVWANATPGARCTVQLYAMQGSRGDAGFGEALPIGEGFPAIPNQLIVGQPGGSGFLLAGPGSIPAELVAQYPTITAAFIMYYAAARYVYMAITPTIWAMGTWDGSFIFEQLQIAGPNSVFTFDGNNVNFTTDVNVTGVSSVGTGGGGAIGSAGHLQVRTDAGFEIDNKSAGRGQLLYERYSGAPFSSTTAATTEQVMATTAAKTFRAGRAYRLFWYCATDSATLMTVMPRVRVGSLAGTNISSGPSIDTRAASADTQVIRENVFINNTAADITTSLVLTFQNGAAAVSNLTGAGSAANTLEIYDVGAAADYSGATAM